MLNRVEIEGKRYVRARDLARGLSITPDYLARLARNGEIDGQQFSGSWFVVEESARTVLASKSEQYAKWRTSQAELRRRELASAEAQSLGTQVAAPIVNRAPATLHGRRHESGRVLASLKRKDARASVALAVGLVVTASMYSVGIVTLSNNSLAYHADAPHLQENRSLSALCVGDTCITATQFKAMVAASALMSSSSLRDGSNAIGAVSSSSTPIVSEIKSDSATSTP